MLLKYNLFSAMVGKSKPNPDKPELKFEDLLYRFARSFIQSGNGINHAQT